MFMFLLPVMRGYVHEKNIGLVLRDEKEIDPGRVIVVVSPLSHKSSH
jgi:hypothetical protein